MSPEGRNQGSVCTSTVDCYLRHCKTCFKLMEFPVLKEKSETWKEEDLRRVQVEMCSGQLNCSQKFINLKRQYKNSLTVELLFVVSSPDVYIYLSQKGGEIVKIYQHYRVDFRIKFHTLKSHNFLTLSVFCHYQFGTRGHICENFAMQMFGTNISWCLLISKTLKKKSQRKKVS